MRVTNRVTNTAMNRKYTTGVNDVHGRLNKAMNRVSSGKAYENAAENPLAYYQGKKLDNQYQDVESKLELISDLEKRLGVYGKCLRFAPPYVECPLQRQCYGTYFGCYQFSSELCNSYCAISAKYPAKK